MRYARNQRLAGVTYRWALDSLIASPGAGAFCDARREARDTHCEALQSLGNRLVGIAHGCLIDDTLDDGRSAWEHRSNDESADAAWPIRAVGCFDKRSLEEHPSLFLTVHY